MGTGATFAGEAIDISNACAVSIVRAGDSLLEQVSMGIFVALGNEILGSTLHSVQIIILQ